MRSFWSTIACMAWAGIAPGCAPRAEAQVVEMIGGSSTLYRASGGSVLIHAPSYDLSLGMGMIEGRFTGGGTLSKKLGKVKLSAGSEIVPFDLPTDIFNDFHVVYAMGGSVESKSEDGKLFAFIGATSSQYLNPYFEGLDAERPLAILRGTKKLGHDFEGGVEAELSGQSTVLASLSFKPEKALSIAASAGIGASKPYGALSFDLKTAKLGLQAEYIAQGSGFRRLSDNTLQAPEPTRGNIQVTWRPSKYLTVSGGQQSYAMPLSCAIHGWSAVGTSVPCATATSTVDEVAAAFSVKRFGLSASEYRSNYNGSGNQARIVSAEWTARKWLSVVGSYLVSKPQQGGEVTNFLTTMEENVNSRLSVNETVNSSDSGSGAQRSVGFGGGWISNLATFHADYQTYYVASRPTNPFEQALILDAQLNLGGGMSAHGQTFVAPNGQILYSADARDVAARGQVELPRHTEMGRAAVHGRVVDVDGKPIEGAAVMINERTVYTVSDGTFEVRESRRRGHSLVVLGDQFLDGKQYRVVSAPSSIKSDMGDDDPGVTIVVEPVGESRAGEHP